MKVVRVIGDERQEKDIPEERLEDYREMGYVPEAEVVKPEQKPAKKAKE